MNAVITTVKNGTRFYLTKDGLASDIKERAKHFVWSYDAQHTANIANEERGWIDYNFHWYVVHILSNGELVLAKAEGSEP